jgi:hypothetical protein
MDKRQNTKTTYEILKKKKTKKPLNNKDKNEI